ncbi:hypothetical protein [Tellurirhabdus rosea]|uniref:hypothetical protein n=1 Tax=Tellurirhabdus rosea TaxID=2674997 RepID=UPI00224C80BD|nr:hypothetical protein [Tellurirhabdus rosea]
MSTVKITKYSRQLPELRTSLSLIQLGRVLLAQHSHLRNRSQFADTIIELAKMDEKIEALREEIAVTELLHEASVLVGNYEELRVSSL